MSGYKNEALNDREPTHGDYRITSAIAQNLKIVIREAPDFDRRFSPRQKESLDNICTKIARLCSGDPGHKDTWEDIAGYANLISERL